MTKERLGNNMAKEWKVKCKDCPKVFGYSDYSYLKGEEKGQSRPERCPECRQKHNRQTGAMGIAYYNLKKIKNTDVSSIMPGQLGKLDHPKRPHTAKQIPSNYDPEKFGVTDENVKEVFQWLKPVNHQVAIVWGPTGSGKSTVFPYRLLFPPSDPDIDREQFTRYGQIVVTQPRIQATRNIPAFVAESLYGSNLGAGYDIGFRYREHPYSDWRNRLVYVTDGTLINWISSGQISNLSTIIIDEAHERSLNIDLILGLLKRLLPRYPHLKLIIASATINSNLFLEYFGTDTAKVIYFEEKRKHNVQEYYQDPNHKLPYENIALLRRCISKELATKVISLLKEIQMGKRNPGDILGFLHGEKPIEEAVLYIRQAIISENILGKKVDVYPLYTSLPQELQNKALLEKPDASRYRVVITTNVAETSLTVEGIVYVVDSGLINQDKWSPDCQSKQVETVLHSKAGCQQRWGRAGRIKDGEAFGLYTKDQFKNLFLDYSKAQIERSALDQVILTAKAAGIDDFENFEWIEKPSPAELERAPRILHEIGALDDEGDLTEHGLELQSFTEAPALANLMAMADRFACTVEMAPFVAMLSKLGGLHFLFTKNPYWDDRTKAEIGAIQHSVIADCHDDLEACLKIYAAFTEVADNIDIIVPKWAIDQIWQNRLPYWPSELAKYLYGGGKGENDNDQEVEAGKIRLAPLFTELREDHSPIFVRQCIAHADLSEEQKKNTKTFFREKYADLRREAWCHTYYLNFDVLNSKVKPAVATILQPFCGHKKDDQIRLMNFALLNKLRILTAICLAEQLYIKPKNSAEPAAVSETNENNEESPENNQIPEILFEPCPTPFMIQKIGEPLLAQIDRSSVCREKIPFAFVAGKQQLKKGKEINQVYAGFVVAIQPEWVEWLKQAKHPFPVIAFYIAKILRNSQMELCHENRNSEVFLNLVYPLRSRQYCKLITLDSGENQLQIYGMQNSQREVFEEFTREEEVPEINEGDNDAEDDDLVDTYLTHFSPIENSEEKIVPVWQDSDADSQNDDDDVPPSRSNKIEIRPVSSVSVECGERKTSEQEFIAEITTIDTENYNPIIKVKEIVLPEPFDCFISQHKAGEFINCHFLINETGNANKFIGESFVVMEPESQLEIAVNKSDMYFLRFEGIPKRIAPTVLTKFFIKRINYRYRQVYLTFLPTLFEFVEKKMSDQRSRSYKYHATGKVRAINDDNILFDIVEWSDPANAIVSQVKVRKQYLHKPLESFLSREKCNLTLHFVDHQVKVPLANMEDDLNQKLLNMNLPKINFNGIFLKTNGPLSFYSYQKLLFLSDNSAYQNAVDKIYSASHQLIAETYESSLENNVIIGSKLTAVVIGVPDNGAGIELQLPNSIDYFIPRRKISWQGVIDPRQLAKVGDKIEVVVQSVNSENNEVEILPVDYKATPLEVFPKGTRVHCRISVVKEKVGLFVSFNNNIMGFIYIGNISNYFIRDLNTLYKQGQEIEAVVIGFNEQKNRFDLSIKLL